MIRDGFMNAFLRSVADFTIKAMIALLIVVWGVMAVIDNINV